MSEHPSPPICSLDRALAFDDPQVIYGFMDKYAVSFEDASELFTEMKKFLWLIVLARSRGQRAPVITDPIMVIDEMWHNFVLFTAKYRSYCEDCFGFYVDHAPTTKAERDELLIEERRDRAGVMKQWREDLREQLSFIYDELGEATVLKWYEDYPRRYSLRRLEALRSEQANKYIEDREA